MLDIKKIRDEMHVSQETLARMLGCSVQSVIRWEKGKEPSNYYKREFRRLFEEIKQA